ncbi:MAG: flagellar hook capping FlgD N-terminal domain-containing protein [Pseudomonadota bacterium]
MTDTAAISNFATQQQSSSTTAQSVGGEFDTFIRLLTAQVRNQDPLSPLDSTQFVEQLATFSSLEQQVQSNASLGTISDAIGELYALVANEWLGQTVTVESTWVPYAGEEIRFQTDEYDDAARVELRVLDSRGDLVWQDNLENPTATNIWAGQTLNGSRVQDDQIFQFQIDHYNDADELIRTIAPRIVTEVTDIASENGKLRLGTSSYLNPALDDVRKYEP